MGTQPNKSETTTRILPQLALIVVPMLWGWGYPLVRSSMDHIGPLTFLFYRFSLGFLVILLLFRKHIMLAGWRVWARGGLIGIALFFGYAFLNWGLVYTTTAKAGFIIGLRVVLVPVLGAGLLKTAIERRSWFGALLSIIGLALIFLSDLQNVHEINPGDLIMLLSALGFAMHVLLVSRYSHSENFILNLVVQLAVVLLLSFAGMALFEEITLPRKSLLWENIAITGLFSTALAFWLQNRFQHCSTADRTGIIFSGEPLFAALFGFIYLGESLQGWQWLGAIFILLAMITSQVRRPRSMRWIRNRISISREKRLP